MLTPLAAAVVTLASLAVLCGPPILALRMLMQRMRNRAPVRTGYIVLCVASVLLLLFNACVALGFTAPLYLLAPRGMIDNPGTTALLFAWIAVGICALLSVLSPQRRHASHG